LLQQLAALLDQVDLDDSGLLCELFDTIPGEIDPLAPAFRKSERLRYQIARQIERNRDLPEALERYRQCALPPCRERMTRILAQQGEIEAALELCAQIVADPIDETELQFAGPFAARLGRKHARQTPAAIDKTMAACQPEIENLALEYQDSVELAAAAHYNALDAAETCYYVENSLFNGVLGLLIWDVIFAPLPGAFFNPFQHRPSDFYAPDFCARRADLLRQAWDAARGIGAMRRIVKLRWQQKFGIMNPLVNWPALNPTLIELALDRIERAHWHAIFERILQDLRNNRAGFPDLVHFPPAGGYCLIEVKGPGDTLQKNQQRWLDYFDRQAIPHRLARVAWRDR